MMNRLLLIGALALSTLALASAKTKTYDIMLDQASKAGNVQLAAGEYHVKVDGNNAVFTNLNNEQKYTVPVKIENADKKFPVTAVDTRDNNNGSTTVEAIELGGSTTKLGF